MKVIPFGNLPDGRAVEMRTLTNSGGAEVSFLNLGGIITRISVPDRDGVFADVTPGYDTLDEYLADSRYFGALVGRYANRIANGRFTLDGIEYRLPTNDGKNHLHGGPNGFHSVIWNVEPFSSAEGVGAVLRHTFVAGADGYPGNLDVAVTYALTETNALVLDYVATTDAPTPVNITQHMYFNLAGHSAGDVFDHKLTVHASHYLPVNADVIPTGERLPVEGTRFDFRAPRPIRTLAADGKSFQDYDHSFVIDPGTPMPTAAFLHDRGSGRSLEVLTTEPGIQLYTGKYIGTGTGGKNGHQYDANSALALETQHFPNSPNEPRFPSTILRPGAQYRSRTTYRFSTM